jgi:periplasmic divalent cation tolerance protein
MAEDVRLVYMTTPNQEEALKLARLLVEERLAACANVLGAVTSVYWWDGKLNEDGEVALIVKTRAALVDALTERVRAVHPYECPCVVALPIDGGNAAFLDWISAEARR